MEKLEKISEQMNNKSKEISVLNYVNYLLCQKRDNALSMVEDCPQNVYIEEWKQEAKKQGENVQILKGIIDQFSKELDTLCDDYEKESKEPSKYYDTFWGHKVSDYALKYGRLDYATMSKCFDCVLCNNINELDPYIFENIESGDWESYYFKGEEIDREKYEEIEESLDEELSDLYLLDLDDYNEEEQEKIKTKIQELESDKEQLETLQKEVFQWFIVSDNALDLLKEANELVLYSEKLDCYIWGVDHWGTSWDYVLTSIKLREREDD